MACSLRLFTEVTEDAQGQVREQIRELESHAEILTAFDQGKKYIEQDVLPNRALDKCRAFVSRVGASPEGSNLWIEVSKLNNNQRAFCAICFSASQLNNVKVLDFFKASQVDQYMNSRNIQLTGQRLERILGRIRHYATTRFLECCIPESQSNTNEINIFDQLNKEGSITLQLTNATVDSLPAMFGFLATLKPLQESNEWRNERNTGQTEHTNCVVAYLRDSGDNSLSIKMGGPAARTVVDMCQFRTSSSLEM